MKRRRLIAVVLVVCLAVGAAGFLVYQAWESSATYYLTVSEFQSRQGSTDGKAVRVSGKVVPGSINRDAATITFIMAEGGESLPVTYSGIVPDTFKDDAGVVVEGKLNQSGVFHADILLAKCPSRYNPGDGD